MRGYSEREIFTVYAQRVWRDAAELVARVGDSWGNDLRCHELSRAVWRVLRKRHASALFNWGIDLAMIDGRHGCVAHSWILYRPNDSPYRAIASNYILDVYSIGRLPQVQLVATDAPGAGQYVEGATRTDIDETKIEMLIHEMTKHD